MPYLTPSQREQCDDLWAKLSSYSELNRTEAPTIPPTTTSVANTEPTEGAKLSWGSIKAFMLAGNATFTLRSTRTGKRFTYKVRVSKPDQQERYSNYNKPVWFVSLLTGPANEADYTYLGMIRNDNGVMTFSSTRKSTHLVNTLGYVVISWCIRAIQAGNPNLAKVEVWHMGKCGRCGRALTVPESIEIGLGPECASKGGF